MPRVLALWTLVAALAGALLLWNGLRFVGTRAQARTKDLAFLPPPLVAQALAMGQGPVLAKLRWIDSFAYFAYQIDRQDDRVAGADRRGGVERLYETLIALDPLFVPFYEHAVLNTGGVLGQRREALGFVMRGLLEMPHHQGLWRMASAELAVSFAWARREPAMLDRWLHQWYLSEDTDEGRQRVLDWRRGLAFTAVEGLDTLPYWLEHLRGAKPGTPLALFVEGTVRELLAEHGVRELRQLCGAGLPGSALVLDADRLAARHPRGTPPWSPVDWSGPGAAPRLKPDPFGWPWRRDDGGIVSPGREQRRFLARTQAQRLRLADEARSRGRPPADAAEAAEWAGGPLPEPPDGGRWRLDSAMPDVAWPEPPDRPWDLRGER